MLNWLANRSHNRRTARSIYGAIVDRSRAPAFYVECGVADTPEGRFEMVVLHLFLLLDRLRSANESHAGLGQRVLEAFVEDMDDSMREMGVGDLSVPKRVRRAAAAFYERAAAYRAVLGSPDADALERVLVGAIPGLGENSAHGRDLARIVRAASAGLASLADEDILAGRWSFVPADIASVSAARHGA